MRYIRLYEEIDFSDIDNYDIGCQLFLFGNGERRRDYIGVIVDYGDGYSIELLGYGIDFPINVIGDYNYGYGANIMIDSKRYIPYNDIDIKEVIPDIMIVGKDISVDDLKRNIDNYKCDNVEETFNMVMELLKEYLN
jgi:hypothetical protein